MESKSMSEGFGLADVIVLAAVAVFIILRYRSVLGQKTGHDMTKPKSKPQANGADQKVIMINGEPLKMAEDEADKHAAKEAEASLLDDMSNPEVVAALGEIKAIDSRFQAQEFLQGSRMALEMVMDAYNKRDQSMLKSLLSEDVLASFEEDFAQQDKSHHKTETTLVSIKSADIIDVELVKQTASITVQFLSEQITVTRDDKGEVVDDEPSHVQDIVDEWVFERSLKSPNPNWTITAT